MGHQKAKEVLNEVLKKRAHKLVYHYSNGSSTREIARKTTVSKQTVANRWKKWAGKGIVKSTPVRGGTRYKKIFELEEFGMEVPEMEQRNKEKGE